MGRSIDEQYSVEEAARRRDEVIRRMANTPPQPKAIRPARPQRRKKVDPKRAARKDHADREP